MTQTLYAHMNKKKLQSPSFIVLGGSTCAFKSSAVCLMKLGAPTFVTYVLTILISS
jgi:hypothetical protein